MNTIATSRIKIEDLPVYNNPSPEELDLVSGAGKVRLGVEVLESRDLMAASITASLIREGGLNVLKIEGTKNADTIIVREVDSKISIDNIRIQTTNGLKSNLSASAVDKVFIEGLAGNDTIDLSRTSKRAEIDGSAGNDTIHGGSGQDTIYGGTGNDLLYGMAGNDAIYGQEGNDKIWGGVGDDTLRGGAGDDRLWGEAGDDDLLGQGGNDELMGGTGNDILDGAKGDDRLRGGVGDDELLGRGGNDELEGGTGNDILDGGKGKDKNSGGTGIDTIDGQVDILRGDTLPDWVQNATSQRLKYEVTITGNVDGKEFSRTAIIVVLPTINHNTQEVNCVDVHMYSGQPMGNPKTGAIDIVTNSDFHEAGKKDVATTTLKQDVQGRQALTIKPTVTTNTSYNVFTKANNLYFSTAFHITAGEVSLKFTDDGKVSGSINVTGINLYDTKVQYNARIANSKLIAY